MHQEKAPVQSRGEEQDYALIVDAQAPEDKAEDGEFATVRAIAARAGWRLDRFSRVGRWGSSLSIFVLSRWGRAIDCFDLEAVRVALRRAGVAA